MKLAFLLTVVLIGTSSIMASSVFSKTYEGCAKNRQEALYTLGGNIQSRINTSMQQSVVVQNNDDVQSKVSSYSRSSTNLSLVNIQYKNKKDEVCAVVHKDDQVDNTKKLLTQALLYDTKNLPQEIDAKIEKLSQWIDNIKQLSYLLPAFLDETHKEQEILNKKEKEFTDLYTASLAYSESLFFKSCKDTKKEAKIALNKKLFLSKQTKEDEGFFSSITSIFSSNDSTQMLDIFEAQIIEIQKDSQICLMLNKEELKNIAKNMYADATRISQKSLRKDPKKRYKEIDNLYEQLDVTKALLKLFPEIYKSNNFNQLNEKRELLSEIKKSTYPQYVLFTLSGADNITVSVDKQAIKNNEKRYLKHGEHTYVIKAKGICPIVKSFSTDLLTDFKISKDLSSQSYPTVTFITDKEPSIVVNGVVIRANVRTAIKECKGETRYLAKYAGQTLSGEVDTDPGETNTVELNFLTAKELQVFNSAKTKNFAAVSARFFSESLTDVYSEQLVFSITREPLHGKVTLDKSGSFQYISEEGFVGLDNFGYEIETPQKTSAPKLVNINVTQAIGTKTSKQIPPTMKEEKKLTPEVKEKKEVKKKAEVSYEDVKKYIQMKEASGQLTEDLLRNIQKKYPKQFEKIVQEKLH